MILACNAKKEHCVVRRMAMEMDVHGRMKRGMPKRRWLDRVMIDIRDKGLSGRKCTTELHGCISERRDYRERKCTTELHGCISERRDCRGRKCTTELHGSISERRDCWGRKCTTELHGSISERRDCRGRKCTTELQ